MRVSKLIPLALGALVVAGTAATLLAAGGGGPGHGNASTPVRIVDPLPVPVLEVLGAGAEEPFHLGLNQEVPHGGGFLYDLGQIPGGKRFVIEQVSAEGRFDAPGFLYNLILAAGPGHFLVPTRLGTFEGRDIFTLSQPLRLIVEGDQVLRLSLNTASGGTFAMSVTGHLVDVGP